MRSAGLKVASWGVGFFPPSHHLLGHVFFGALVWAGLQGHQGENEGFSGSPSSTHTHGGGEVPRDGVRIFSEERSGKNREADRVWPVLLLQARRELMFLESISPRRMDRHFGDP